MGAAVLGGRASAPLAAERTPSPESLPFHPRKLVEEAHGAWLGFRYVGRRDDELDPRNIDTWSFTLRTPVPQISVPAPKTSWWRRLAAH